MNKPTNSKQREQWTLLLVGSSGKTIRIRWFQGIIILVVTILIIAVTGAGVFGYLYGKVFRQNEQLRQALSDSGRIITALKSGESLPERKTDRVLDVPPLSPPEQYQDFAGETADSPAVEASPGEVLVQGEEARDPSAMAERSSATMSLPVAIEDFRSEYDKRRRSLDLRFEIRKIAEESGQVSGFIVLVLKQNPENRRQGTALPEEVELLAGRPDDPEKGQGYSIVNYKTVRFRAEDVPDAGHFTVATVFIYDDAGVLLMEKDMDLTEEASDTED